MQGTNHIVMKFHTTKVVSETYEITSEETVFTKNGDSFYCFQFNPFRCVALMQIKDYVSIFHYGNCDMSYCIEHYFDMRVAPELFWAAMDRALATVGVFNSLPVVKPFGGVEASQDATLIQVQPSPGI